MPKYIKIGKTQIETKSMLVGLLVGMVGLSFQPTQTFFGKILSAVNSVVGKIGGKK